MPSCRIGPMYDDKSKKRKSFSWSDKRFPVWAVTAFSLFFAIIAVRLVEPSMLNFRSANLQNVVQTNTVDNYSDFGHIELGEVIPDDLDDYNKIQLQNAANNLVGKKIAGKVRVIDVEYKFDGEFVEIYGEYDDDVYVFCYTGDMDTVFTSLNKDDRIRIFGEIFEARINEYVQSISVQYCRPSSKDAMEFYP